MPNLMPAPSFISPWQAFLSRPGTRPADRVPRQAFPAGHGNLILTTFLSKWAMQYLFTTYSFKNGHVVATTHAPHCVLCSAGEQSQFIHQLNEIASLGRAPRAKQVRLRLSRTPSRCLSGTTFSEVFR